MPAEVPFSFKYTNLSDKFYLESRVASNQKDLEETLEHIHIARYMAVQETQDIVKATMEGWMERTPRSTWWEQKPTKMTASVNVDLQHLAIAGWKYSGREGLSFPPGIEPYKPYLLQLTYRKYPQYANRDVDEAVIIRWEQAAVERRADLELLRLRSSRAEFSFRNDNGPFWMLQETAKWINFFAAEAAVRNPVLVDDPEYGEDDEATIIFENRDVAVETATSLPQGSG